MMNYILLYTENFIISGYIVSVGVFWLGWLLLKKYRTDWTKILMIFNILMASVMLISLLSDFLNSSLSYRAFPVIISQKSNIDLTLLALLIKLLSQGFWWKYLRMNFLYAGILAVLLFSLNYFGSYSLFGINWWNWFLPIAIKGPLWINYTPPEFNLIFGLVFSLLFIGFYFLIQWFFVKIKASKKSG